MTVIAPKMNVQYKMWAISPIRRRSQPSQGVYKYKVVP